MKKMKALFVLITTIIFSGCAGMTSQSQLQTLTNMTSQNFRDKVSISDDSLDTVATLSTVNGFKETRGLLGIVWDDSFLRAFVDKKTGSTIIQLYQSTTYTSSSWHNYQTVNFETPNGPESAPVTTVKHSVDCSLSKYNDGACNYNEQVVFQVNESLLRTISRHYHPNQMQVWQFKFTAQSGKTFKDGLTGAEISGFMEALDNYRIAHGFSNPN